MSFGVSGVIFVVIAFTIACNATNALYKLSSTFLCLVVILVLVERRFGATVLGTDMKVIVPGVIGVVGLFGALVVNCFVFVCGVVGLDRLSSIVVWLLWAAVVVIFDAVFGAFVFGLYVLVASVVITGAVVDDRSALSVIVLETIG